MGAGDSTDPRTPMRGATAILLAYANRLGVGLRRVRIVRDGPETRLPRRYQDSPWHPWGPNFEIDRSTACAFRRDVPEVVWGAERIGEVMWQLPHEVTHARWPGPIPHGPSEEWTSGMIPFEIAWLERLAAATPGRGVRRMLGVWTQDYAIAGRPPEPDDERRCWETAKRVVADAGLPDPWAAP